MLAVCPKGGDGASWQMTAVAALLRLTRKRGFATEAAGRALMGRARGSSVPARSVATRLDIRRERVRAFEVYVIRARGDRNAGGNRAAVYLHGGAYTHEMAKQHWSRIAHIGGCVGW